MKRLLQILLLLGMTVVWVLTPVTQTVQAEKSKDETHKTVFRSQIFTGPITLTARLFTDTPHWQAKIEWTATGTVFINFPKTNLNKRAKIEFNEFHLIRHEFGFSDDDVCTDLFYYSRDTYPPFDVYGDWFDVKEKVFKLPVKLGESQLTGWAVAGMCKGTGDPMKGKLTSGYEGYPKLMDPIMLYVSGQEGQTYIYGKCKLPMWELGTSGYSTYTTDCKWEANLELINKPPEWWMPPAKRKK